ncbi:hypothetical protein ACSNOI_40930 [Actinomadura kijaniata]|uniref:hypothetical protein n=1 Tax=Actinomadura kijaniata TaxID=46161 RepID=UPI003F1DCFE5
MTGPWPLVAGWVLQVVVRLLPSWGRDFPLIHPDEPGYLIAARWLAGGAGTDFSGMTFYRGGYPLLLTPAYWLTDDPRTVYTIVLVINALVGALLFPLARSVLLRCGVGPGPAAVVAWVAALLPAATLYGGLAMSDAVLPVVVLGWLLAADRFARHGTSGPALLASALAAYSPSVHARGTIVLLVHVLFLAAALVRGPGRRNVLFAGAATGAVYGAVLVLNARLTGALYPGGPLDLGAVLQERLTSPSGLLRTATAAGGQIWAMAAGTWGLGAVGLIVVIRVLVRRSAPGPDRVAAALLLATTAGITLASTAALPDEHRVGNFAYGRYIACMSLVYLLVGLAALLRRAVTARLLAGAAALLCGLGGWLLLYLGERLDTYTVSIYDFPDIGLLGGGYLELRPLVVSLSASVLLLVLCGLFRWGLPKLAAALLVLNVSLTFLPNTVWRYVEETVPPPPLPVAPAGGVAIERHPAELNVLDPQPQLVYSRLAHQVWWTELRQFDPAQGLPSPDVCTVVVSWPAGVQAADTWPRHPPGWRYQRAGALGALWWVVWYAPDCPRRATD